MSTINEEVVKNLGFRRMAYETNGVQFYRYNLKIKEGTPEVPIVLARKDDKWLGATLDLSLPISDGLLVSTRRFIYLDEVVDMMIKAACREVVSRIKESFAFPANW